MDAELLDQDGVRVHMDVGRSAALLEEIRILVADGRLLQDVLPFVTSNVARLFRLPQKSRIAVGADADLVVLGQSLAVREVLIGGQWFVRNAMPVRRGLFELSATS